LLYEREISAQEAIETAKASGVDSFIECSVKSGENVEEAFKVLVRLMLQNSIML